MHSADASVALLFADSEHSLRRLLESYADALPGLAYVWIAYPKGGRADINRDSLWPIVAEHTGMRPITQVSLDDTWSALRFRPLKPGSRRSTCRVTVTEQVVDRSLHARHERARSSAA